MHLVRLDTTVNLVQALQIPIMKPGDIFVQKDTIAHWEHQHLKLAVLEHINLPKVSTMIIYYHLLEIYNLNRSISNTIAFVHG